MSATVDRRLAKSTNVSRTPTRTDGTPVATPVGGVVSDGTLLIILIYANTQAQRLPTTRRVIVARCNSAAPSTGRPTPRGAPARLLTPRAPEGLTGLMASQDRSSPCGPSVLPGAREARSWSDPM